MKTQINKIIGKFILGSLVLNCFTGFALFPYEVQAQQQQQQSQRPRTIIVNAEQPNVWTLEQAHYLLAQMHRRNLDLKAKSLQDLDPNEINGLRFEVLRTLIELGVKFDQADLTANRLLTQNQNFNSERRQSLIARRDRRREESLDLTRDITQMESDKANAETEEEKEKFDKQISAKTALRARVDKELEQIDKELETLPAPSGSPQSTKAEATFDADKLPKSDAFDQAFKDAVKEQIESFNKAPKLNASLRLENFLQMQYEIIAKQLTLLRDEVGPGERLLFLELPQTVNATHDKANKKWAQSWWRIDGYTAATFNKSKQKLQYENKPITPTSEKMENVLNAISEFSIKGNKNKDNKNEDNENGKPQYISLDEKSVNLPNGGPKVENRLVRTVEMIPRQSSLNVNDMNLNVKSGALSIVASFLFGFGSSLKVQRQREQFSQFVQQELYSSAFGKGSREFGWTFMPMPGTDRLLSGARTTYAIVVVPKEATSLVVESNGCYFPRSEYQPNNFADTKDQSRWGYSRTSRGCGDAKAFIISIPSDNSGENNFWVSGISYQPVDKGNRIVVSISGDNFSSQLGVLVNGVPLIHSIGLAQPLIRDDSKAFEATSKEFEKEPIQGRIERVDSNKIIFSFKMPADFEDTPTISLIAPGRAIDINWLTDISINGTKLSSLSPTAAKSKEAQKMCADRGLLANCVTVAPQMFKGDPERPSFRIDSIEAFRDDSGRVSVVVTGAGFSKNPQIFVNGIPQPANTSVRSDSLIVVNDIVALSNEKIQVTLTSDNKTIKSKAIANPAVLKVDKTTVVSYEASSEKKPGVLVVRIEGVGFPAGLMSPDKKVKVTVTSSSEAFLRIENPDAAEMVTLKDPVTNISVNTVVTRKAPK